MSIITIEDDPHSCLRTKCEKIQDDQLPLAREIAEKLILALTPHFPAAGLAAPQIGINRALFIFSFDRDPKNLEVVINPSFKPIGEGKIEGWEGCLSVILCEREWKIAHLSRYNQIEVSYLTQEGEKREKILEGFAARVFQHEYDHLQGIINIDRKDALVKSFNSKEEMFSFLQAVKEKEANEYEV